MNPFCKSATAVFLNVCILANQVLSQIPPPTPDAKWIPYLSEGNPAWWTDRGAVLPGSGGNTDFATAKQGQLKHFASKAVEELDINFPGGAGTELKNLVLDWQTRHPVASDNQFINQGQLKWIASKFYSRLNLLPEGNQALLPTWLAPASTDNQVVNVGQLKKVFGFALNINYTKDTDGDGIPDAWELANGSNPNLADASNTPPGGGATFSLRYNAFLSEQEAKGLQKIPALTIDAEAPHQAVTSLKGSFSVGGDGASNYSIPIDIPKGTAGMEPKLNIGYSSNGGNGLIGLGWSLGGLQRITRGPKSTARESGAFDPMDFDANDRYFLDGEKLVCVSGEYGRDGSEYRTEIDSYARIKWMGNGWAHQVDGYWKIWTKAGLIVTLGGGSGNNSSVKATEGTVSWGVNKVEDTLGNYYTVAYADDSGDAFDSANYRVSEIRYTGTQNTLPYCSIHFEYDYRPDVTRAYSLYSASKTSKRLTKILVKTAGYINHSYRFNYEESYQSGRSLLKSISKHQEDRGGDLYKVNPTVFTYDGIQPVASGSSESPIWENPYQPNFPIYGNGLDSTQFVNSVVTVDPDRSTIKLIGDVSRAYPFPYNPPDRDDRIKLVHFGSGASEVFTKLTFEFRSFGAHSGAVIGLDESTTPSAAKSILFRIGGTTNLVSQVNAAPIANSVGYTANGGWQTYQIHIGKRKGNPNNPKSHLILMCVDNEINDANDGVAGVEFRNIKFYRSDKTPNEIANIASVMFASDWELPRFSNTAGKDTGVVSMDFNADGLPDFSDWRAIDIESKPNNKYDFVTKGSVFLNSGLNDGSGFYTSANHQPPTWLPISVRETDDSGDTAVVNNANHVIAQPIDIDGDGELELFGSVNLSGSVHGFSNYYKFYNYNENVSSDRWRLKQDWDLPFFIGNITNNAKERRDEHFQWVDLNADGYQDLVVHTTGRGRLFSTDSPYNEIIGGDEGTAFINNGKKVLEHRREGLTSALPERWTRRGIYKLPERLLSEGKDNGLRMADFNGDGLPELARHVFNSGNAIKEITWMKKALGENDNSYWKQKITASPVMNDRYFLPYPLLFSNNNPTGAQLMDLNGDGLVDCFRANHESGNIIAETWINQGSRKLTNSAWNPEPAASENSYRLPSPIDTRKGYENESLVIPYGHEMADVNGDGLVDILFSDTANNANSLLRNTGTGWKRLRDWGIPGGSSIYSSIDNREKGKRGARLMDVTGDGFPDLVTDLLSSQAPRVWKNKCVPEVLSTITDGMGSQLTVNYRRLNDPTPVGIFDKPIYEKGKDSGRLRDDLGNIIPGIVEVIDSRLVVYRYSEPNGKGGQRWRSQRYGQLRYDRYHEVSLGFGWIEAIDNENRQIAHVEYSQIYPFVGSPLLTKNSVKINDEDPRNDLSGALDPNQNIDPNRDHWLSVETASYGQLPKTFGTGGTVRRPVQTGSVKITYDLARAVDAPNKLISQTTTTQEYLDESGNFRDFGFVKKSTVTSLDGTQVVTVSNYDHYIDSEKWHLGRLRDSTVTKTASGKATITKNSSFSYYPATGLLSTETIQPGTVFASTKTHSYDIFGNTIGTTINGSGRTRSTSASYVGPGAQNGRFMTSSTDQVGYTSYTAYDRDRALIDSATDITGRVTTFKYDAHGTLIRTTHPDRTVTGESTGNDKGQSLPNIVKAQIDNPIFFYRAKQVSGSPVGKVYLDAQGREIVTQTKTLLNATSSTYIDVYSVTRYDRRGRKIMVSQPFTAGETPIYTEFKYDILSRPLLTIYPKSSTDPTNPTDLVEAIQVQSSVPGLVQSQPYFYTRLKNRDGKLLQRWEDQHGRLVKSEDGSGQTTYFHHDLEGRLLNVKMQEGTTLTTLLVNTFDILGNKTSVWEANSGTSTSAYNSLGEVLSTTNAKNQQTFFTPDTYGRPYIVQKPEGTYTTTYFTSGPAKGTVEMTEGSDGSIDRITSVDPMGRPLTTSKTLTRGGITETFQTVTNYDVLGRVVTAKDAGGLTVLHEYDRQYSVPVGLKLIGEQPGKNTVLWRAGTYDSKGNALTQTLANGVDMSAGYDPARGLLTSLYTAAGETALQNKSYKWDTLGNLESRSDLISQLEETFGYDGLNRVRTTTYSNLAGSTTTLPPTASYDYDSGGKGNLVSKPGATMDYLDARPHAVSAATIKGAARTYAYDAAGYVENDGKRTYTWTTFGQLRTLDYASAPTLQTLGGTQIHAASRVETNFSFDAGGNRLTQTKERTATLDGSSKHETTYYLGSYEREIHQSRAAAVGSSYALDRTVHRHSIGGFAVYTRTEKPNQADETKLTTLLKDHLGSTDVLYVSTWNGTVFANATTERQSFDAWGERRDPAALAAYRATDGDAFRTSGNDYDRGYTGHEQLDDSGLIHMNGRLYDPELGRMLSPDPFVQVPEFSQNFNRYSYVMNNPLNMTDPTGFSWLSNILGGGLFDWAKENWRTVVVIAIVAVVTWGVGSALMAAGGVFVTAATATTAATLSATGLAVTGAIAGAVGGGLNAAFNGGNLGDVLRGALIGAVQGAITGGLLHGLGEAANNAGGFFTQEAALHIAGHGVVGGTANEVMGGKFADGFFSAAAGAAGSYFGPFQNTEGTAGVTGRTIQAGVIGGTTSVIGGGKFANGAYTAAFQHLLNYEAAPRAKSLQHAEDMLSVAEHELGVRETGGYADVNRIKAYHNSSDAAGCSIETRWCSSFVNWVVKSVGGIPTGSAWARNWMKWGRDAGGPVLGAIVVFGNKDGTGHVGFVAGITTDGKIRVLGGNQSDSVKYSNYSANTVYTKSNPSMKVLGYRVPNISNRALIVPPTYYGANSSIDSTR